MAYSSMSSNVRKHAILQARLVLYDSQSMKNKKYTSHIYDQMLSTLT